MNYIIKVFQNDEQIYEENMGEGFDFKAFKQMLLTLPKKRIRRKKEKAHPLFEGKSKGE